MNLSPEHVAFVVSIAVGIGTLLPILQAVIQRPSWSPRVKAVLAVALAIVGGAAGYVSQNGLDFGDPAKLALWIVGVYTAATTLYARLLRPSGVTDAVEQGVNGDVPPPHVEGPNEEGDFED